MFFDKHLSWLLLVYLLLAHKYAYKVRIVKRLSCLAVKTSIWQHIELFKIAFKVSRRLLFCLLFINQYCTPKMFCYEECVLEASRRQLFTLFLINQYYAPNLLLGKTCAQSKWETAF